jgi:hypothetical protein
MQTGWAKMPSFIQKGISLLRKAVAPIVITTSLAGGIVATNVISNPTPASANTLFNVAWYPTGAVVTITPAGMYALAGGAPVLSQIKAVAEKFPAAGAITAFSTSYALYEVTNHRCQWIWFTWVPWGLNHYGTYSC